MQPSYFTDYRKQRLVVWKVYNWDLYAKINGNYRDKRDSAIHRCFPRISGSVLTATCVKRKKIIIINK